MFTFSSDNAQIIKIVWYVLGPVESKKWEGFAPSGKFRLKLLAKYLVSAALNFERNLEVVVERVISWDTTTKRPFKVADLLKTPKVWLKIVEEQSRSSLHAHCLIWLYGHKNLETQFFHLNQSIKDNCYTANIFPLKRRCNNQISKQMFNFISVTFLR